ncbi:MAG: HlyD family efflux transporter periplasmic adaptor subunit [Symploca sp. SIO2E9]|nr:HlyD family efflux transporter periplasmic adaptor subunit [Symploca sp. SIO2E9]
MLRTVIRLKTWLSPLVLSFLVIAPIGIIVFLTVTVIASSLNDPETKIYSSSLGSPARQRKAGEPIEVEAVAVTLKTLEDSLAAPGESVALQEVEIRPLVTGKVKEVYVMEGDWIRQGQPLLKLHQSPFQDKVYQAQNNLAIAIADLKGLELAAKENLSRLEHDIESAKVRLDNAQQRVHEIEALLEQEVKNNVEAAQFRLETAREKLERIKPLIEIGAVPQFNLHEAEDVYATRKKELLNAQQGRFGSQDRLFSNQDVYIVNLLQLKRAQQALERTRVIEEKNIARAHLNLENRKIQLRVANRNLENTVINANTDALVSRLHIHAGDLVSSSSRADLMILTSDIVFKAYVDQARLEHIEVGDQATVRLTAYPGRTFSGQVIKVNPTIQTEAIRRTKVSVDRQYTYSVWVKVSNLEMPPGLQGYVQFDKGKTSLFIPESAVTHLSGGEGMVMVVEAGKAVVKKVKLGRTFDNQRELLEGLQPGEQVVLHPRVLNPGDALKIVSQE